MLICPFSKSIQCLKDVSGQLWVTGRGLETTFYLSDVSLKSTIISYHAAEGKWKRIPWGTQLHRGCCQVVFSSPELAFLSCNWVEFASQANPPRQLLIWELWRCIALIHRPDDDVTMMHGKDPSSEFQSRDKRSAPEGFKLLQTEMFKTGDERKGEEL